MSPQIVLGSTSVYRRQLLERLFVPLGLSFTTRAPGTVEDPMPGESAEHLAIRLAQAKARDVAKQIRDNSGVITAERPAWIIGSDQAALRYHANGSAEIINKPETHDAAVAQLLASSGKTLVFNTAICLLELQSGREQLKNVQVSASYRKFGLETVKRYLNAEPAYDCAGATKSEGLGISLLSSCSSDDPSALVGLPLIALCDMFTAWGWELL